MVLPKLQGEWRAELRPGAREWGVSAESGAGKAKLAERPVAPGGRRRNVAEQNTGIDLQVEEGNQSLGRRGTSIPGYPSVTVGYPTHFQKGGIDIPPALKMLGWQFAR